MSELVDAALAYCVEEPRGTRDLDVNIFRDAADAREVLAALPEGVEQTPDQIAAVERDGQARLFWEGVPVDAFLDNIPLHDEVAGAVVWVWMEGRKVPMLDCASLVVFKSLSGRTKDWGDIEAITLATPEDVEEAAATIAGLVGEDDPAFRKLREIRERFPPPAPRGPPEQGDRVTTKR